jgi:hypothetical protein
VRDETEVPPRAGKAITHVTGLPGPLDRALSDKPFSYLVVLRNGLVIEFEGASQDTEPAWITLLKPKIVHPQIDSSFNFARGISVRISDIVAAADASHGS